MPRSETEIVKEADDRMSFVLAHPGMSTWVKQALTAAVDCDPVDVLNGLEILSTILRPRSEALCILRLSASDEQLTHGLPD